MTIYLTDYANARKHFTAPNKPIAYAVMQVLSGDEVLDLMYQDGEHVRMDASDTRAEDFVDSVVLYKGKGLTQFIAERQL